MQLKIETLLGIFSDENPLYKILLTNLTLYTPITTQYWLTTYYWSAKPRESASLKQLRWPGLN